MRAYHDQALIDEFFASEAAKPSANIAASMSQPSMMKPSASPIPIKYVLPYNKLVKLC
jgi:hypothetical protein